MKLEFYEADMLAWFLRDFKDEFIECAENFGWETFDAEKFHDKLTKKIIDQLKNNLNTLCKHQKRQ